MKRFLLALVLALVTLSSGAMPLTGKPSYVTVTFKTTIHCKNCVRKINDNIPFEKGVKDLKVSLDEKLVTITYDPSKTDETTLAKAIEKLGYKVESGKN